MKKFLYFILFIITLITGCASNDLSDWQTYTKTDEIWNLSFKYPKEYKIESQLNTIYINTNHNFEYRFDAGYCPEYRNKTNQFEKIIINENLFFKDMKQNEYIYFHNYPNTDSCIGFNGNGIQDRVDLENFEKIIHSIKFNK